MDVETASALERVLERIDGLETAVRGDIAGLDGRIAAVSEDATRRDASLRADVSQGLAEVRRHAQILNEQTNDTLRVVAEAVAHLSVKVDSLLR